MASAGCHSWDKIIDEQIYQPGSGTLRMVGSSKTKKGVDIGRLYSPLLVIDGATGEPDAAALDGLCRDRVTMLRSVSVRRAAPLTPGFTSTLAVDCRS